MGVNNQQTKAGNGNQRHRPGNKRGAARLKRAQIIKQPLRIVHRNRTPHQYGTTMAAITSSA